MSMFKVSFIFSVLFVVFGAARGFLGNGDTFRRKVRINHWDQAKTMKQTSHRNNK